ncbi:RNA-directed DNA polymerase, eukaryota, reverse transcriptase zinc-binding domain protein [Tanacetum coccineum]
MANQLRELKKLNNSLIIILRHNSKCFLIDDIATLFTNKVTSDEAEYIIRDVYDNKTKEAVFDIEDYKAPGLDSKLLGESAFIPGRNIHDNILLSQELLRRYNKKSGAKRVDMKIDIAKAYDTVDWYFLDNILNQYGFHKRMVKWIMTCVSTTAFTVNCNGKRHGYLQGGRGLRQGDPLSPYLFTLVMKVFTLIIARKVKECKDFKYHLRCKDLSLTHMCFVDDLLVIFHGDVKYVKVIRKALTKFSNCSGLLQQKHCVL